MLTQKCICVSLSIVKKIIILTISLLWCICFSEKELYCQVNPDSLLKWYPDKLCKIFVYFPSTGIATKLIVSCDNDKYYLDDVEIPKKFIITKEEYNQYLNNRRFFSARGVISNNWDGVIPFKIEPKAGAKFNTSHRDLIINRIEHMNERLNLCIRQKNSSDNHYVAIVPVIREDYSGQSEGIGKIGGRQEVRLDTLDFGERTVVHELLHAFGLIHEQCRDDRDEHVRILWDNIRLVKHPQFYQEFWRFFYPSGSLTEDYDYNSIMHYFPTVFLTDDAENNGLFNMQSLDPSFPTADLGSNSLSDLDIEGINLIVPNNINCEYKLRQLVINEINTNGTIGTTVTDKNIDDGWSEIDVVKINGRNYMLMFDDFERYLYIQELNSNGTLGSVIFEESINDRYENFNFFSAKTENSLSSGHYNQFILHDYLHQNVVGVKTYFHRINESNPFSAFEMGEPIHIHWPVFNSRESTSRHKKVIAYNYLASTYLFFYGYERAMFYKLRFSENPFSEHDLGSLIYYSAGWRNSWTTIKIFSHNLVPYMLFYNAITGYTKIYALDLINDFRNGFGPLVYEDYISKNWKVIEIYNQSANPNFRASAFMLFIDKEGITEIVKVRNTELPFRDDILGDTIYEGDRSGGYTTACTFTTNDKLFLIRLKK